MPILMRLPCIDYLFGLRSNSVLSKLIQAHSDFVRLFLGDFMSDVRRARIV